MASLCDSRGAHDSGTTRALEAAAAANYKRAACKEQTEERKLDCVFVCVRHLQGFILNHLSEPFFSSPSGLPEEARASELTLGTAVCGRLAAKENARQAALDMIDLVCGRHSAPIVPVTWWDLNWRRRRLH